jgi:type VI secretion system protein ImpL
MTEWRGAFQKLSRPQVAVPTSVLAATGATAGILGFVMGRWIYVIVVVLVVLVGLLGFLIYTLYSKEREERVRRGVAADGEATVIRRAERRAAVSLEEGFRKAVAVIEARKLEELPWYLVLGAPGAGKTALLRTSGLELPAAVERLVEAGPTASCNWWLTNQAVVIDTAGRYTIAHEGGDHREWTRLLALVGKHRPRPALQGVIVVLSAAELLTKGASQLEQDASELRRHLNEVSDGLGVDPPIYLIVTQADRVQGFAEAAAGLGGDRLQEVIGWTNRERHPHDVTRTVREGLGRVAARFEAVLPDLLVREPDAARRRRLFFLPEEITTLARVVSRFAGRAFAPGLYDEVPFLRGVYLASALREGATVSPTLVRLGHAWAQSAVEGSGPAGSWFLRDFFHRLLLHREEQTLTVPTDRVGPRTRAVMFGLAGAAAVALVVAWGVTFWRQWTTIDAIHEAAVDAGERRESLEAIDHLVQALSASEAAQAGGMREMGLGGPVERATDRGRRVFVARFSRDFEEPAKQNLLSAVRGSDRDSFAALQDLAADIDYLASRGAEGAVTPAVAHYSDVRRNEPERVAFAAAYAAYVRWAPEVEIEARIEAERQRLDEEAPRLLDVTRLEAWCEAHPEAAKPIRYQDVGLSPPGPGAADHVSGCFTRAFFEERLAALVRGLERSGKLSQQSVERFRSEYGRRYGESWEDFLVTAPRPPAADPEVKRSPYAALVARIEENLAVAELWRGGEPSWVRQVREVRRREPAKEGEQAPWARYEASLEAVDAQVERVRGRSQLAFDAARAVADGQENAFQKAVDQIREELVPFEPTETDRTAKLALRSVLVMPILNGFSAVLESAAREVDQRWRDQIVAPFPPPLPPDAHDRLYGPGGALARFRRETLEPFVAGSEPRPLLEDRALPLRSDFIGFVAGGGRGGAGGGGGGGGMPSGPQTVRLIGAPSELRGGGNVFVTGQELTLHCGTRPEQRFEYTDGVGEKVFTWTPDCVLVQLLVRVRGSDGREVEIPREWNGPYAFSSFLREGVAIGDGTQQWTVRDQTGSGISVGVRYRRRGGEGILRAQQAASQAPPSAAVN